MQFHIIKVILGGYVGLIIIGAMLLSMPNMHNGDLYFVDALFTSASALTCTGLIVKDTALDFTFLGQIVILAMIQIGGFGYMSLLGILYLLVGKRLNNIEKNLIKENLNYPSLDGLDKLIKKVFVFVIIIEMIGASILSTYFIYEFNDVKKGLWAGVFHAISAFNNSGFSIFSSSLTEYRSSMVVNLTICGLIIIGGLGYVSCLELGSFGLNTIKRKIFNIDVTGLKLSLHSKIVLVVTTTLIFSGMGMILLFEWKNTQMFNMPYWERVVSALFTSVNYRTAGFNTVDISHFSDATMFFSTFFMNVGGSPGGTASGIKVTTITVLIAFAYSIVKHKRDTVIFRRKIPDALIAKSFSIFTIAAIYIFLATFLLAVFEPSAKFLPILFEVSSAFATVGMSTGNGSSLSLSANFNEIGLAIIMLLMVSGKIGILSFTLIFAGNSKPSHTQCVQERIVV